MAHPEKEALAAHRGYAGSFCGDPFLLGEHHFDYPRPVSYTHLDVYKRQLWYRSSTSLATPAAIGMQWRPNLLR